jgi:hypothetical protein
MEGAEGEAKMSKDEVEESNWAKVSPSQTRVTLARTSLMHVIALYLKVWPRCSRFHDLFFLKMFIFYVTVLHSLVGQCIGQLRHLSSYNG